MVPCFRMKNATNKVCKIVRRNRPLKSILKGRSPEEMQEEEDEINYGNHPGEEWRKALCYQSKLRDVRIGVLDGAFSGIPRRIYQISYLLEKLREDSAVMRREFSNADKHPATLLPNIDSLISRDHFDRHHISKLSREIKLCGQTLILGWLNEDEDFFTTLAGIAQIAFGTRRKRKNKHMTGDMTNAELCIHTAVSLWYVNMRNPNRESVLEALRDKGVEIRPKDHASFFRRCHLAFLKNSKSRGRPRKIPHTV